ncbi:Uncharacterized protein HZ326_14407 [Fusarium oxysporum f. sp. albedinis]|nr:Uncharacterized protein HZ326_14407 [Fusarium oxysporum f. sp. albedinis]
MAWADSTPEMRCLARQCLQPPRPDQDWEKRHSQSPPSSPLPSMYLCPSVNVFMYQMSSSTHDDGPRKVVHCLNTTCT